MDKSSHKLTSKISKLHLDLLGLKEFAKSFTREKANNAFLLSQGTKFLEEYKGELIFDSNDEPKLMSFYNVAKGVMSEVTYSNMRDFLAKKFKEGEYSYQEALNKVKDFNTEMEGSYTFMATVKDNGNGKFMFTIVPNTKDELLKLIDTMAEEKHALLIIQRLESLGVGVEGGLRSLYNTKGPKYLTNGLLGVISYNLNADKTRELGAETGHFIVDSLGRDNPLVARLINLIDKHPEIAKEILGESEYDTYWSRREHEGIKFSTLEYTGHIIGRMLELVLDYKDKSFLGKFKELVSRAINYLSSRLHITNRDYAVSKYNAISTAYKLAKEFMGENFQGSLETALSTPIILKHNEDSLYSNFHDAILEIDFLISKLKGVSNTKAKEYDDFYKKMVQSFYSVREMQSLLDANVLKSKDLETKILTDFLSIVNFITLEMAKASGLLNDVRNAEAQNKTFTIKERANIINYNKEVFTSIKALIAIIDNIDRASKEELGIVLSDYGYEALMDIKESLYTLTTYEDISNGLISRKSYETRIIEELNSLALDLLTEFNGSGFIAIDQYIHFSFEKGKFGIQRLKASYRNLEDELLRTDVNPGGWVSRYINSIADNPDLVDQIVYQIVEERKHEANLEIIKVRDLLMELFDEMPDAGIKDTRELYETMDDGSLSGNLKSRRHWGKWEARYDKMKLEFDDAFWEKNKDMFDNRNEMYFSTKYLTEFGNKRLDWHLKNSYKLTIKKVDPVTKKEETFKILVPAISTDLNSKATVFYDNEDFNKIAEDPKKLEWYNKYQELKVKLDDLLPNGCTNKLGVRAPQFKGTFTRDFANIINKNTSLKEKGLSSLKTSWSNFSTSLLGKNPEDTEYGGHHNTYDDYITSDGEVLNTRVAFNTKRSVDRLPIYGVRKISDMNLLSTDLIQSTLAYASMAINYDKLLDVVGSLEVLKDTLYRRKAKNLNMSVEELKHKGNSSAVNSYDRLADYMTMYVYNNYTKEDASQLAVGVRNGLRAFSSTATLSFLGGNVHGATVNLFTAFNMILREAVTGQDFTLKDFAWAFGIFSYYETLRLVRKIINTTLKKGSVRETKDKLSLFIEYFDIKNDNDRKFRNYHTQSAGYGIMGGRNPSDFLMLPYTITERWIQSMAALSVAKHTKLRNKKTNEESSVWGAYIIKDGKLVLKGNREDWEVEDMNLVIMKKALKEKVKLGITLTDEEANYFYGSTYVPWDSASETRLKLKIKGINNRMHGVYSTGDSGAYSLFILGPIMAALKKYAIGLFDSSFATIRYDARDRRMRLGFVTSSLNLIFDSFTSYSPYEEDEVSGIKSLIRTADKAPVTYKLVKEFWNLEGKGLLGDTGAVLLIGTKLVYASAKVLFIGATAGMFSKQYLLDRGYNITQVKNITRGMFTEFYSTFLSMIATSLLPPDDDEEPQEKGAVSDVLSSAYITLVKAYETLIGKATVDDENLLTKEFLENTAYRLDKTVPYSGKGMIYYLLARGIMELSSYSYRAFGTWGLKGSFFTEVLNLTDNSLPPIAMMLMGLNVVNMYETINEEEYGKEVSKNKNKANDYDYYYIGEEGTGKKVYSSGPNKKWYKSFVSTMRITPYLRSFYTLLYPYKSFENYQHMQQMKAR